ncbi:MULTISPECIES: MTAP family purine nucleoside phosphorylase [Asticcacaulis]|uniref:MTAP family purine nucleoside phosphorylase n=1 Tax=Asticcacaulis TaxID=76890 RepID=UPI001AE9DCEB|nr:MULTISPECIES: MTAP family purine nucleoside phosphorylase [Asticcacaulis]MBP2161302.1 5'-methylthioadenosine phosphorylase [Asticcacaulis solisilvae]MDR6802332.1 5'-methylthioadenosine phosphorylase [Asticcacaulis sp. BE141]
MLSVIGGSGFYALDGLEITAEHRIETPFGQPSGPIAEGRYLGQRLLFLARHGAGHRLLPHEVNYRANIFALKQLGARRVFSLSASGSLREEIRPGDLAVVSQYFDHTRGKRAYSFFGDGVAAHVSTAHPACPALSADIARAAARIGQPLHMDKTYACVEGPRLGTRAESFFLRDAANCDLVGMTNVPEAFLAREAQMAYCTVCVVTDYDCWMDDPSQHVSVSSFLEVYAASVAKGRALLAELMRAPFSDTPDDIRGALKGAVMTPDSLIGAEQKAWLEVLRR